MIICINLNSLSTSNQLLHLSPSDLKYQILQNCLFDPSPQKENSYSVCACLSVNCSYVGGRIKYRNRICKVQESDNKTVKQMFV